MKNKTKIVEIFTSIQGEGPYVGKKQLFIRLCGCNLNCDYCDTPNDFASAKYEFSAQELYDFIQKYDLKTVHSISLTGGEPLLSADFLKEFLPLLDNKIYLETNATLAEKLAEIKDFVDIISADIKLPSSSGVKNSFELHDKFFAVAKKSNAEIFAKIVFDEKITDEEIKKCADLAKKYGIELVLQPKTENEKIAVSSKKIEEISEKFYTQHKNLRVIPQVHVLMGVD